MSAVKAVAVSIGAVFLIGVIVVGGYLGGWWLQTDTTNRHSKLLRKSFERQATYRDEMVRKIEDIVSIDVQLVQSPELAPQLGAQRKALVHIVCRDNGYIQGGLDSDTSIFVAKECS